MRGHIRGLLIKLIFTLRVHRKYSFHMKKFHSWKGPLSNKKSFSRKPDQKSNMRPALQAVLRIHDILVRIRMRIRRRIRIRRSIPLTNGSGSRSGSGSCYYASDLQDVNKKLFFAYFLKVQLNHFSKITSHKEVTKKVESMFFLLFLLDDRKIRFRFRIRISD